MFFRYLPRSLLTKFQPRTSFSLEFQLCVILPGTNNFRLHTFKDILTIVETTYYYNYSPLISSLVPAAIPKTQYHISFTKGEGDKVEHIINYKFNLHDIVCLICCSLVGTWYLVKKVTALGIKILFKRISLKEQHSVKYLFQSYSTGLPIIYLASHSQLMELNCYT